MKPKTLGWIGGFASGYLLSQLFHLGWLEALGLSFAGGFLFGTLLDLILGGPDLD